jgi:EAL domain-containing protein (putative c-di-GMP-specific phosphodiesterase class I)/GGDEF domain-containing protein
MIRAKENEARLSGQAADGAFAAITDAVYTTAVDEAYASIIKEGEIRTMFQPILSLKNGEIYGYESLTRGPKGAFENPLALFDAARRMGSLWELELICRSKALENFAKFRIDKKIFLNVDPDIIYSDQFRSGFTKEMLDEYGILPENVVFEVTERKSISDMEGFKRIIGHYKDQGYKIAIDDAGAGYSGLNLIADIHPHFIKLDMQLVRDIDKIGLKYALVKNLNEFCQVTGIKMIAEGVETEDELRTLIDIGAEYGQGFLFQKPSNLLSPVGKRIKGKIEEHNARKYQLYGSNCSMIDVGKIASRTFTIPSGTLGNDVKNLFMEQPSLLGIPVVDDGKVQGLVMRDKFFMQLGTQYGFSLYSKRPVRLLMDRRPLVIDCGTSLENASKVMTARSNECLYDIAVVVRNHRYLGTISVKDVLNKTMEIEVNHAKHLNPLTGLPGNILIERQLEDAIRGKTPFTILYIDIDNFKAYNDAYGFELGDKVLLYMKDVLAKSMMEMDLFKKCFIGHIGGDDFVVIIFEENETSGVCGAIFENFLKERNNFYNLEDITNGFIVSKDRHGKDESYSLMTISIAGLKNDAKGNGNVYELTERISRIKRECKSGGGNRSIIRAV